MNKGQYIEPPEERNRKTAANMVPFFSWRSILSLALGLVLGALLGLVYYLASPLVNPATNQVWESNVQILVTNPTNAYIDSLTLRNKTEIYIIKAQSLPFLEYLSQKIAEEEPQYSHNTDELAEMISIEYNTSAASLDTSYIMTVTTPSEEETAFLAVRVPEIFISYLVAEEIDDQQQQYQNTLEAIETTKEALLEAQSELADLAPMGIASNITNDPDYVMITAEIKALQDQLALLTPGLADIITQGSDNSQDVNSLMAAIERTTTALIEAQKELANLETQWMNSNELIILEYQLAQDKVANLSNLLTILNEQRDSLIVNYVDTSTITDYLVIANPSIPAPPSSLQLGTSLLLGAIIGIIIAWVILNFRWFTKGASTSPEEEED